MPWQAAVNHDTMGRVQQNPHLVRSRYAHKGRFPLSGFFECFLLLFLHHLSLPPSPPRSFSRFSFYFFFILSFSRPMQTEKYQRPILLFHLCARRSSRQVIALCKVNRELPRGECQAQCRLSFFLCEEVRDLGRIWNFDTFRSSFVSFSPSLPLSLFLPFFPLPFYSRVLTMFRPRLVSDASMDASRIGEYAASGEWFLDEFLSALLEIALRRWKISLLLIIDRDKILSRIKISFIKQVINLFFHLL